MKAAIVFLALVALVASVLAHSQEFENFQYTYNKVYKDDNELQARLKIFKDNKEIIDEHNERYARGLETFEMGVNQFTDLTPSEFRTFFLGSYNRSGMNEDYEDYDYEESFIEESPENYDIPKSVNWVKKGAVTRVKDQGNCGSCWAFAAVGTLEGQHFLKTGKLVELSEQNLLDCSGHGMGCNGGWAEKALKYVKRNHGIDTEKSYRYRGHKKHCKFNRRNVGATVKKIIFVTPDDELALASKLAKVGPIAVAVEAKHFQHYSGGVLRTHCHRGSDHAVTLVGYGHDARGGDYWLVKNSWGSSWGEDGYIRMARNAGNMCYIASEPVYPIV